MDYMDTCGETHTISDWCGSHRTCSCVVFKYSAPISRMFHNVKEYAKMPAAKLQRIRASPSTCAQIPAKFKQTGHLLTTDADIFPTANLRALASMGAKYIPNSCSGLYTSEIRDSILGAMGQGVKRFADRACSAQGFGLDTLGACKIGEMPLSWVSWRGF